MFSIRINSFVNRISTIYKKAVKGNSYMPDSNMTRSNGGKFQREIPFGIILLKLKSFKEMNLTILGF